MSDQDGVPVGVAVPAGIAAVALGAALAWAMAPDSGPGSEPASSAPASFNWQHEAGNEDVFSPEGGFNAWLWTWPDGSQDWCFHYTQSSSNESTQPVCKPVPSDYNTAPGNAGTTMEDHQ